LRCFFSAVSAPLPPFSLLLNQSSSCLLFLQPTDPRDNSRPLPPAEGPSANVYSSRTPIAAQAFFDGASFAPLERSAIQPFFSYLFRTNVLWNSTTPGKLLSFPFRRTFGFITITPQCFFPKPRRDRPCTGHLCLVVRLTVPPAPCLFYVEPLIFTPQFSASLFEEEAYVKPPL